MGEAYVPEGEREQCTPPHNFGIFNFRKAFFVGRNPNSNVVVGAT